jgi:hypothetical protein
MMAAEPWQSALDQMPLLAAPSQLNRTNCVKTMLAAFQSNSVVKALIFMPGATDEFYMFRRARAALTNANPTLLEAVNALTNQTLIRVTFYPPFVLLHTDEDPLEPLVQVVHEPTADKLRNRTFLSPVKWDDKDWPSIQPLMKKKLRTDIQPWRNSYDSWHFYRLSVAAWGLSGWETLQAVALAGKTKCTVQRGLVVFEGDERIRATPKLEGFVP